MTDFPADGTAVNDTQPLAPITDLDGEGPARTDERDQARRPETDETGEERPPPASSQGAASLSIPGTSSGLSGSTPSTSGGSSGSGAASGPGESFAPTAAGAPGPTGSFAPPATGSQGFPGSFTPTSPEPPRSTGSFAPTAAPEESGGFAPPRKATTPAGPPSGSSPAANGGDRVTVHEVRGRIEVADEVVEKVAGLAAMEVEGVADLGGDIARALETVRERIGIGQKRGDQGIKARITGRDVAIDVVIMIEYGHVVMNVARAVKQNVAIQANRMLGLRVVEVNVIVDDVRLPKPPAKEQPEEPGDGLLSING